METYHSLIFALVFLLVAFLFLRFIFKKLGKNTRTSSQKKLVNEQIYVGNLPYQVNEDDLDQHFSRFGQIDQVKVIRHFESGRSKGYAFVTYFDQKDANKALKAHGQDLQGRAMVVRIAKPKQGQEAY